MSKQSALAKWPLMALGLIITALLLAGCGDATTVSPTAATTVARTSKAAVAPTVSTAITTSTATTSAATTAPAATTTVAPTTNPATTTATANNDQIAAEAVVRKFVDAANRKDSAAVANSFAPNARFDSIGRIYQGRDQIMSRFLQPEVLDIGGQYEIIGLTNEPGAITFEFNFRAGSLSEHFTYRCVVQNGLIQDVVGRYVNNSAPATTTTAAGNAMALDPAAQCYVEAVNAKNLDGLVNCFAADGQVMDVSRPIKGQAAIRTWAQNEVIGGKLEVQKNEAGPGRNRLLVHWSPAGSNGWQAYYTFDFKDGKITLADLQYAN